MTRDTDPPLLTDLMRFKPDGWTPNAWAVEAGVSRTVWTDIRRHGNPSRRTLEKLLVAAGSSLAEFEALRVGAPPPPAPNKIGAGLAEPAQSWRAAPLAPIPLYQARPAAGSLEGAAALHFGPVRNPAAVDRPASLSGAAAAFALPVVDDAMAPRFRRGRTVIVVPGRQVEPGDDVLVVVGDGLAAIAQLIERRGPTAIVRQHRSDDEFEMTAFAIHLIVGEAL